MKALHLTFRFGKDVYGGAEYHMYKLTDELHKKGVDIDICTTKTHKLTPFIKSGTFWDNGLKNEMINSIAIYRFPVNNPNRYLSLIFEKLIQNQLDKEEKMANDRLTYAVNTIYEEKGGILLSGWNLIERYGNFVMRWTKKNATILIKDDNICEINFSILNRKKLNAEIILKSQSYNKKLYLPKNENWEKIKIDIPDISGKLYLTFNLNKTFKPLKDFRNLGIGISEISYKTNKSDVSISLEYDYKKLLIKHRLFIDYLISNTKLRPTYYGNLFDYLRGPNSSEMINWLDKNIERYDLIMAQMFPFNTIKYSMLAKKYNKPLILMPLMHVDDEFYHWKHYYNFMKGADIVLANSLYSKINLFDKIGVKSVHIGAGIDKEYFLNKDINGNKFREKYNLSNKKLILTVSRKSPSKRYELLIRAMTRIKHEFKDAHLIMIGPDEDNLPINSEFVTYLGKVSENDLVNAYDACDIFAMMSESESFGMVYCEAWARKKPVIGNKYCGPVYTLIDNGVDGFLCDENDLAEKIHILLSDENLGRRMGEKGYEKILNQYTWDIIGNKVKKIYEEMQI